MLVTAACVEEGPTAPPPDAAHEILDGANNGGNRHFFFLPPIAPAPSFVGTPDGSVEPTVTVCALSGSVCGTVVAEFTVSAGTGSSVIAYHDDHYQVNWRTDQCAWGPCALSETIVYRLRVAAADVELGHADLRVFPNASQARSLDSDDVIALVEGRTLPIRFRIEEGIVGGIAITPAATTVPWGGTAQLTATVLDLSGEPLQDRVVQWSSSDATVASIDPDGLAAALKPGSVSISASSDGITATTTLTVRFTFASLSSGEFHTCALNQQGKAYCWGRNDFGQVGNGTTGGSLSRPTAVVGGHTFTQIAAGSLATCALRPDGVVFCWGANNVGSLGDGTFTNRNTPAPVQTPVLFKQITNRGGTPCAIALDDNAWCWGWQDNDRLGNSGNSTSTVPVQVLGGHSYQALFGGTQNTCGLTFAGATYCWGVAGANGSTGSSFGSGPLLIAGGHVFTTLAVGQEHACGLEADGELWCWGVNSLGSFGNGSTSNSVASIPVLAAGGARFVTIDVGLQSTCGVTTSGQVLCWGRNDQGQLGDGTTVQRLTPVPTGSGLNAAWISMGRLSGFARGFDDVVYGWGDNFFRTLGDGTTTNRVTPVAVLPPLF